MKHSSYEGGYLIIQALVYKIYSFTNGVSWIGRDSYHNV